MQILFKLFLIFKTPNKKLNLSPLEAFVFAQEHSTSNIFIMCEFDEEYDYSAFDDIHRNNIINYAKENYVFGIRFDDEDLKKYIKYKDKLEHKNSHIMYGLKYLAMMKDKKLLSAGLNDAEAEYFIRNKSILNEVFSFNTFLNKYPHVQEILNAENEKGASFEIKRIQETEDYEIISKLVMFDENNDATYIYKVINKDGIIEQSNNAYSPELMASQKNNSNMKIYHKILNSENGNQIVPEISEIYKAQDGMIIGSLESRLSDKLESAYETTALDVILHKTQDGFDGDLVGETPLALVIKNPDESVEYTQFYECNGTKFESYYWQDKDNKENIYTIRIDGNSGELANYNRSFEFIDNNTTLTTVNGKKFICRFSENTIIIQTEDNSYKLAIDEIFEFTTQNKDIEFLKTIPADILLAIKKTGCKIEIDEEMEGGFYTMQEGKIYTSKDLSSMYHELGHVLDFGIKDEKKSKNHISQNSKLKEIYTEELDNYRKKYPYPVQQITIDYFSKTGIPDWGTIQTINTGLSEIVAETKGIMTTYAMIGEGTQLRSNVLIKNFPKTIAKCIELLEKESKI